ncbi:PP2C family protein-serine/threonine phosphatase [Streptomyces sp. NPDC088733]|uniref:PP2C family protein-serine/threonine phosphatase n=1 Tax=Streptomyces sp. NPDC088733 TaxID=3365880 RepID=UPI0037F47714
MNTSALHAAERALRAAAPHALADAVRRILRQHYGAGAVDVLLADYGQTVLQPVAAGARGGDGLVPIAGSPAGRAFGAQEPVTEAVPGGVLLHLPVSVRGDRIGVLSAGFPAETGPVDAGTVADLGEIAEMLGHHILVADRDTDLYLRARRRDRLTLAAEIQWQLLPGHSLARPGYSLGAQLEPAYDIHGDNFDWSASEDDLTLTVTNGMGQGIEAALLTSLAVGALRNARRAGVPLADQAALADQAVFARYRGGSYVSVLLMRFEPATGTVDVVDAGSPRVYRLRDGAVDTVPFEPQMPLGMFEDTPYVVQRFEVRSGDRLVVVSDGVYETASASGERYGEQALARAMLATRLVPPADVPRAVLRELPGYRAVADAEDDALVLCLDWDRAGHAAP